ncbi:MAG: hypothetical protein ACM65K_08165 [Microcoleus sp.]
MSANAGDRPSISPEAIASKIVEEAKTQFLPPLLFLYNLAKAPCPMPHAPCPMPHAPLPIT